MATETTLHSKAPARIDLAGGTVDIWPLYLFLKDPLTINVGIDLFAEATLTFSPAARGQGQVTLESKDQSKTLLLSWEEVRSGTTESVPPGLILHAKLLTYFAAKRAEAPLALDLKLSTQAKSPAGAGLGGSSTLAIAMVGALSTWAQGRPVEPEKEGERFIEIVRDVETTVIRVPAGMQDYYGAMFGGLQTLGWGAGVHKRRRLDAKLLPGLDERLLLFYSGQSRNSGINNWALFKHFIDGEGQVREKFAAISEATRELESALEAQDWKGVGRAIASEWKVRQGLAAGISTPEIQAAFEAAAKLAPSAGKICGAGGGGCFFVYLPDTDPGLRARVESAVTALPGIRALPFKSVPHGLEVTHRHN